MLAKVLWVRAIRGHLEFSRATCDYLDNITTGFYLKYAIPSISSLSIDGTTGDVHTSPGFFYSVCWIIGSWRVSDERYAINFDPALT